MAGGPDATTNANGADWKARDRVAQALKVAIGLAPFVVAAAVSVLVSFVLPVPSSWPWAIGRVAIIAVVSMVTIAVVERIAVPPVAAVESPSAVAGLSRPHAVSVQAGAQSRQRQTHGTRARRRCATVCRLIGPTPPSSSCCCRPRSARTIAARVVIPNVFASTRNCSVKSCISTTHDRQKLQWAALIHDMGKITVPPEILNKKGKPTDAEWAILQNHPMRGEELVAPVAEWLGEWVHAVGGHHERWDGTGYPRQLAGNDIPRAAAIVAVADSFEVMTAVRSYKSAMSLADARAELTRCSGTHFSPDIVRAFLNISLPKLRRAGGALGSLAHVPFIGNALTASAKAPEAWGYALSATWPTPADRAVAAAAVTGVLIAAPATAGDQHSATTSAAAHAVGSGSVAIGDGERRRRCAAAVRTQRRRRPVAPSADAPPTTTPSVTAPSTTRPAATARKPAGLRHRQRRDRDPR